MYKVELNLDKLLFSRLVYTRDINVNFKLLLLRVGESDYRL